MKNIKLLMGTVFLAVFALLAFFPYELQAQTCSTGDRAVVNWKGQWYPATVIKTKGNRCYVHYDGYHKSWDEWVGPQRIRLTGSQDPAPAGGSAYSTGEAVMVSWKGSWWPAHVVKVGDQRWYITYDNYDSSWNEWVGPDRIKKR